MHILLARLSVLTLALAYPASSQETKWTASDAFDGSDFGTQVAFSGDTVIIGAPAFSFPNLPEQVYVFDTSGQELGKLLANPVTTNSRFGQAVAIDGDLAVVGAPWDDAAKGAVFVFDTATLQLIRKIVPTDVETQEYFGRSVGLFGTTLIVGCPRDHDNGIGSGSVYLYDALTGQLLRKILHPAGMPDDYFGGRVAIQGSIAVVTASEDDTSNGLGSGSAFIFDVNTGQELAMLLPTDGEDLDHFGMALALDDPYIVVGAPYDDDGAANTGAAYVFDLATGAQLSKFIASDRMQFDYLGREVAIDDWKVAVDSRLVTGGPGSVYVFDATTGEEIRKITASDGENSDYFGYGLAMDDGVLFVGAPLHDDMGNQAGAVYRFGSRADLGTSYCGPANLNSSGKSAVLRAFGWEEAGFNSVLLEASDTATQQFGMFLNSLTAGFVTPPGSQGNLCLAAGIGRYKFDIQNTGTLGQMSLQLDLKNTPTPGGFVAVQSGETWYFQGWFRDKNPGSTSNFTDGVSITFE